MVFIYLYIIIIIIIIISSSSSIFIFLYLLVLLLLLLLFIFFFFYFFFLPLRLNISYEELLLTVLSIMTKVASLNKHTQFKTRELKPYSIQLKTKIVKTDTQFMTKTAENPYLSWSHVPKKPI